MSGSHALKPAEIFRQMPRDLSRASDHSVEGHGGDCFQIIGIEMKELHPRSTRPPMQL
jgi:hypothetical protein